MSPLRAPALRRSSQGPASGSLSARGRLGQVDRTGARAMLRASPPRSLLAVALAAVRAGCQTPEAPTEARPRPDHHRTPDARACWVPSPEAGALLQGGAPGRRRPTPLHPLIPTAAVPPPVTSSPTPTTSNGPWPGWTSGSTPCRRAGTRSPRRPPLLSRVLRVGRQVRLRQRQTRGRGPRSPRVSSRPPGRRRRLGEGDRRRSPDALGS